MAGTHTKAIGRKIFTLATDLDGTFLGGSDADRARLYGWIEDNRDTIGLIFVTGRDPEFIEDLTAGDVPRPDYVVGDVGTTIAEMGPGPVTPIPALEAEIAAAWGDGGERVRAALDGISGLTLQPTEFRYRVSYDMDPEALDPAAHDIVAGLGYDVLTSADRFFDVLPRGISKGPSILRLVDHLGLPRDGVLVAGDTLNDLSMLVTPLPAVAVGGSEPALLAALDANGGAPNLHRAEAIGAGGILEAVAAFNLHPTP
ncbi:HAD-IIB family hydrolase [Rhodobacterales bacterium HKCCE2091]|nr:HAD-IIB family hydrolase [Rhodobacterales bacterium HKCCE2091]